MSSSAFERLVEIFDTFNGNVATAYYHIDGDLSYAELHAAAAMLSETLAALDLDCRRAPVIIYGHKDRRYPIAYWACILAGRPLIPIEPDIPVAQMQRIRDHAGASIILDATSTAAAPHCKGAETILVPTTAVPGPHPLRHTTSVAGTDTMYIMFSSGTSGSPKGVRVSYENVVDFLAWLAMLFADFGPINAITGNVRFCFDVSLFELWTSWLLTKPLSTLDYAEFFNSRKYIARLREHRVTTWVSTPTMMRRYLADPRFRASELPSLNTFLFCGEVLSKNLVAELWNRFDGSRIFNTYGPTECTVAVTGVRILQSHVSAESELPIGYARQGTRLFLDSRNPNEKHGEIIIRGRAVGPGYLNLSERQKCSFPEPQTYRTGDWGRVEADGLWYFEGRMDREYKIQGIRIDLNDVETHIRRRPGVLDVVADIYCLKGEPHGLRVFVLGPTQCSALSALASDMASELPPYLIPRFWYGVIEPELTLNGKLQRSTIAAATSHSGIAFVYHHDPGNH